MTRFEKFNEMLFESYCKKSVSNAIKKEREKKAAKGQLELSFSVLTDSCDLYAKYDPVSRTLQGELCIKDCDGGERWEPVELLPSEQEMIVGLMEEICQKDMGRALRDTWADHHPAINRAALHQKKSGRCQHER